MIAGTQYIMFNEAKVKSHLRNATPVRVRGSFAYHLDSWAVIILGLRQYLCSHIIAYTTLDQAQCYFQPVLRVGERTGSASFNEIRTAAAALISQCGMGARQGGIASHIGMSERVTMGCPKQNQGVNYKDMRQYKLTIGRRR